MMKIDNINVKHLPNKSGRDYFVGDIHGMFDLLEKALKCISFDFEKDRLFCCGDLIDRGSQEHRVLEFLQANWFFPCMGNHDYMFLENLDLIKTYKSNEPIITKHFMQIKYPFLKKLSTDDFEKTALLISEIPLSREIITRYNKRIGCIHAEIPAMFSWDETMQLLESKKDITNAYNKFMFLGERGEFVPPDLITLYENLFILDKISNSDIINNTAKDLDILFLGHNITPIELSENFNFDKWIRQKNNNTKHIKFIDHGAFITEQMATSSFGMVIYDEKGEQIIILDSEPL